MIKIVQIFVEDLPVDEKLRANGKYHDQIRKYFDLTIVAEGVEAFKQLELLLENGCEFALGFCFSRRVLSEGILSYVKNCNNLSVKKCLFRLRGGIVR